MLYRRGLCTAILLAVITTTSVFAQSGKLKKAKESMNNLDYMTAIQSYQSILQGEDNSEAKINLAECYRKINDTENAEYWYGQVVRLPEAQPVHKLYYGMMLQINGKCDLAKEWYDQFAKEVPEDVRGQYLVKACDYSDELMTKNAGIYEIAAMPFNSNLDDFSPSINKNQVIFASERDKGVAVKRQYMWTGNDFTELYAVDYKEKGETPGSYTYGRPEKYSKVLNTKLNDAAVAFSPDGKTIFFTRNNIVGGKVGKDDNGIIRLKILYASLKGEDSWKNLESLPFNSDEYSVAHPTISADGNKLYFSSDMPGGFGGMDLYVSEQESGRWGPPVNLGPSLNTEAHEIFPFIDKNNRLYFSSDGHIGLGGLDIYYATEKGMGEWNIPVNIGYPLNTSHDDCSITFGEDGTWGYFTSDRDGGAGRDDIYGFKKIAAPVEVLVVDATTLEPIPGASVMNSMTGNTMITGADGKISFDMKLNDCADFSASKEGYSKNMKQGCTKNITAGETVRIEIPLDKVIDLELQGIVFDMTDGLPATGAKVTVTNDCGKPNPDMVTTTEEGRYKFKLDKECCYIVKAEKDGFIAVTSEGNCTKGLKQNTTLNANLNLSPITPGSAVTALNPDGTIPGQGDVASNEPKNGKDKGGKDKGGKDKGGKDGKETKGNDGKDTPPSKDGSVTTAKDPKSPSYNENTGLYEYADGTPANGKHKGMTYKDGEAFDKKGNRLPKPAKSEFPTSPSGEGYLVHIYYDFDQASIRSESESELTKLLKMMNDNPDFIVEIASHTDARGSDDYNFRLSQRRAESVINWLKGKGIKRDRLVARGYGEAEHVNNCVNKNPCSEAEHQVNRRTEFRILGCKGGANVTVSKPVEKPRVDPCENCPF
jgi:outer membrane protein OmpA-like peptidoglycan-associated protein